MKKANLHGYHVRKTLVLMGDGSRSGCAAGLTERLVNAQPLCQRSERRFTHAPQWFPGTVDLLTRCLG
ncbi:MAG TPA: hypothetical protein VGB82_10500 [Alphaproteobacteria bacterium]